MIIPNRFGHISDGVKTLGQAEVMTEAEYKRAQRAKQRKELLASRSCQAGHPLAITGVHPHRSGSTTFNTSAINCRLCVLEALVDHYEAAGETELLNKVIERRNYYRKQIEQ